MHTHTLTISDNIISSGTSGVWHHVLPTENNSSVIFNLASTIIGASEQKENNMRGLFDVYIVHSETDAIHRVGPLLAKSEEAAKMAAWAEMAREGDRDVDDFDFVVVRLGSARAKRQVQEVKMVNE